MLTYDNLLIHSVINLRVICKFRIAVSVFVQLGRISFTRFRLKIGISQWFTYGNTMIVQGNTNMTVAVEKRNRSTNEWSKCLFVLASFHLHRFVHCSIIHNFKSKFSGFFWKSKVNQKNHFETVMPMVIVYVNMIILPILSLSTVLYQLSAFAELTLWFFKSSTKAGSSKLLSSGSLINFSASVVVIIVLPWKVNTDLHNDIFKMMISFELLFLASSVAWFKCQWISDKLQLVQYKVQATWNRALAEKSYIQTMNLVFYILHSKRNDLYKAYLIPTSKSKFIRSLELIDILSNMHTSPLSQHGIIHNNGTCNFRITSLLFTDRNTKLTQLSSKLKFLDVSRCTAHPNKSTTTDRSITILERKLT